MKYRDPETIAPINGTEELLLAIYDRLGELLEALRPVPLEPIISEVRASEAASILATHEHQTAPPKPEGPPNQSFKGTKRKPRTTSKKKAT